MYTSSTNQAVPIYLVKKEDTQTIALADNESEQLRQSAFDFQRFTSLCLFDKSGKLSKVLAGIQGSEEDPRSFLRIAAYLSQALPKGRTYSFGDKISYDLALGWGLGYYQFTRFKTARKEEPISNLVLDEELSSRLTKELKVITFARDLINSPNNEMRPSHLSEIAKSLAKDYSLNFKEIVGDELIKENYPTIHAVGKGSAEAPRLLELRGGKGKFKVTIVGKAVCFDTGGYDIKPSSGMRNMKKDMGGGALALALVKWLCEEQSNISFRMLVPAVENRISDKAFVPGDIIKTRKGKFVEVDNTDAEGRLVLCDALTAAFEEETDLVVDFSTLTGACRVALGPDMPGMFTDNDGWAAELQELSFAIKDPVWRLPLWRPYFSMLKSGPADFVNSASSGFAGSVTAALYLKEFVADAKKWIHFDTYCWSDDTKPGTPQGADTQSLRAVFNFLQKKM